MKHRNRQSDVAMLEIRNDKMRTFFKLIVAAGIDNGDQALAAFERPHQVPVHVVGKPSMEHMVGCCYVVVVLVLNGDHGKS